MTEKMPTTKDILDKLRTHAPDLRKRGILHAALFGSLARGEQTPASDIDLAVTLDPQHRIGLIALAGLQRHVSKLLNKDVDLVTLPVRRQKLRSTIEREAIRAF